MLSSAHNGFLWFTIMPKDNLHTFSLRLPADVNEAIEKIADKDERSKNQVCVIILRDYIRANRSNSVTPTPPTLRTELTNLD